jgi:hypothetical protein
VEFQALEPRSGIILRITQVAFAAKAADPDGDPLTYAWDFDDGQTELAGAGISHIFDKAGHMNVTARVQDGRGGQAAVTATLEVGSVSGTYVGLITNGPNAGLRIGGSVTQTGRRFDGNWSTHNGDGTGDSRGVAVGGVLSDPRNMTFTVFGLCGGADATFRGAFSDDLTSFGGDGPGCGDGTFRKIELFR